MSATNQPFKPKQGSSQTITVVANTPIAATIDPAFMQIRILNTGSNLVYACTYNNASGVITPSATELPIPTGVLTTITKEPTHDRIAFFSVAGTTILFSIGNGW